MTMVPAPAHHGYEHDPGDLSKKEPVNLWHLFDSPDIQYSALFWLPETFFLFYEQCERLVVEFPGRINTISEPYYIEVALVGVCDDGVRTRVYHKVFPEEFDKEQRLRLMAAVRKAHPQGTKDFDRLRIQVAKVLGVPSTA